jgi:hypothetical protein
MACTVIVLVAPIMVLAVGRSGSPYGWLAAQLNVEGYWCPRSGRGDG